MAKYGFCSFKPQNFAPSTCFQLLYEQYLNVTSTACIFTSILLAQFNQTEIQIKYWPSRLAVISYSSTYHRTRSFLIVKAKLSHIVRGLILISGPISVAARSKVCVCGGLLTGIAGSIPAGSIDVCLL